MQADEPERDAHQVTEEAAPVRAPRGARRARPQLLGGTAVRVISHVTQGPTVIAWGFVALLVYAVLAGLVLSESSAVWRASFWGLVMLASFAGWGQVCARLLFPRRAPDLGLRLAWGAGLLIAVGGLLALVSAARKPVLGTLVVVGAGLAALDAILWSRRAVAAAAFAPPDRGAIFRRWPPRLLVVVGAISLLALWQYLGGAAGVDINWNDDYIAYFAYPKQLLATGSLIEPFSVRRMAGYGGQSLMQAMTLIGCHNVLSIPLFDLGISLMIVLALVLWAGGDEDLPRGALAVVALVAVTIPNSRINTASQMSGVLFFLAMFRTATWTGGAEHPAARAWMLGLLTAAACTLRNSYVPAAAMFLAFLSLPQLAAAVRSRSAAELRPVAHMAAAVLLFLLPWALLSYRSNHTLLFPLMKGTYRAEYGAFTSEQKLDERVAFLWSNFAYDGYFKSIPIFVLAGLLIPGRRTRGALPAFIAATALGFGLVAYGFPLSDAPNVARYSFGFTTACILAIILASLSPLAPSDERAAEPVSRRVQAFIPLGLVLAAVVVHLHLIRPWIDGDNARFIGLLRDADKNLKTDDEAYKSLQATIPRGERLLVMLDRPFWLNFSRNRINILDMPGSASPAPGMPLNNQHALVSYLRKLGYRYVAFVHPSAADALYRRDKWTKTAQDGGGMLIWKLSAPFYLKMFDQIDELSKSRVPLFDDGKMFALDLDQPLLPVAPPPAKEPAKPPAKPPEKPAAK